MPGRKKSHSEQWWTEAPATARRCKAALKKGGQCKRVADLGSVVCENHGALAPQVQRRAKETLMLHASGMADMLLNLAYDPMTPVHLRVKLAQDVLDRTGIDRSTTVVVGTDPLEALFKQLVNTPGALEPEEDVLELEANVVYDAEIVDDPLGDAFADAQRVVDPQPEPDDDGPGIQPMPPWMAKSYGNGGSDS